jgi:hypothetical protein
MKTLAHELSNLARKEAEKNKFIEKTLNDIYNNVIQNIRSNKCVWDTTFTSVETSSNIVLSKPVIDYVELYYTFNKECETLLAKKFEENGFKLLSIALADCTVASIRLAVISV